jgi:hypothetical protein
MARDDGSGRQVRRHVVEDCSSISVGQILGGSAEKRANGGLVRAGHAGSTRPRVGFGLGLGAEEPFVQLFYDNAGRMVRQTVRLVQTRPHFGGQRWWFVCPVTGERVAKLYLSPGGRGFVGRLAADLTYLSCRESGRYRAVLSRVAAATGYSPRQVLRTLNLRKGRGRGSR